MHISFFSAPKLASMQVGGSRAQALSDDGSSWLGPVLDMNDRITYMRPKPGVSLFILNMTMEEQVAEQLGS